MAWITERFGDKSSFSHHSECDQLDEENPDALRDYLLRLLISSGLLVDPGEFQQQLFQLRVVGILGHPLLRVAQPIDRQLERIAAGSRFVRELTILVVADQVELM